MNILPIVQVPCATPAQPVVLVLVQILLGWCVTEMFCHYLPLHSDPGIPWLSPKDMTSFKSLFILFVPYLFPQWGYKVAQLLRLYFILMTILGGSLGLRVWAYPKVTQRVSVAER